LTIDTSRIVVDGTFYKDYYYKIETEAKSASPGAPSSGSFRLNETYLGWRGLGDWVAFQAGLWKIPTSQEETTSSRFIDFTERSVLNRITPGRGLQAVLYGSQFDKILEWNAGVSNGHTDREDLKFINDNNDEKDILARLFVTPFKNSDLGLLKQMRFGWDGSRGKRDSGAAVVSAVSSGDLALPGLLPAGNAGVFVRGVQTRNHINFSWLYGPASLRAEYARVRAELDGGLRSAFVQRAWYIQATYLITGEDKTLENRIKPKNNFDPLAGGFGAWELAARWAVIDGSNGVSAGVYPAAANHKVTEYTFGINWWMTPNVRLMINLEHLIYDVDVATGFNGAPKRSEDGFYVRWQIDF
jgi:phosphate-selective porin OprO/OprP